MTESFRFWVFGMTLGEIESEILHKLWVNFEEDEYGAPADELIAFNRYSRDRIRRKIDNYFAKVATVGETIPGHFVVFLNENFTQYPVPQDCIQIRKVWYFSSATEYIELPIVDISRLEDLIPGWRTRPGTPQYAYAGDVVGQIRMLGIAPAPSDVTFPLSDPSISPATWVIDNSAIVGAITGAAGIDSTGTTYVDSEGRNFFLLGVRVGMKVQNKASGAYGMLTGINTTNGLYDTLVLEGLHDGSSNVWNPGDVMLIIPDGSYTSIIYPWNDEDGIDGEIAISPQRGQLPLQGITMSPGSLLVEGFFLPTKLSGTFQFPQLAAAFQDALIYGPAGELAEERPTDSPEFAQSKTYFERFNQAVGAIQGFSAMQYKQANISAKRWRPRP